MYNWRSHTWMAIAIALGHIAAGGGDPLPDKLQRCRVDDEACILRQTQTYVRLYKNGIPERNVPSIDPFQLGTLSINSGGDTDSVQFNLIMSNTTLHNFADTVIFKSAKGFTKDLNKPLKLLWSVTLPAVELRADYEVEGKILILPIVSHGKLVIKLNEMQSRSRIRATPEKRADGHTYLKVTEYKSVGKVASGHFNLTNLFNDNAELRDSTLKVLNDEWDALSADIQPKITEASDRFLSVALQKLLDTLPYDEFFKD
ncbi:circadian clock-controlled protein daywake [Drosophila virilis]|uniref:Circadian clock-controlled protein n=1 Tax=Drosophila virilis TaxID=7244 RepID=B4M815_DROVI|nr:circadian clock-controlled protein [Drosophila virilis]EDW62291.1 uncharacterized protein Dvir_GJ16719 [Drosophila virilis]